MVRAISDQQLFLLWLESTEASESFLVTLFKARSSIYLRQWWLEVA